MYGFNIEQLNLNNESERQEVITFLNKHQLEYENDIDCTIIIKDKDAVVATCSKAGNILKCFAVNESLRGMGVAAKLVTWMNNKLFDQGIYHSFIFTKTEKKDIFTGIGYKVVQISDNVVLLENGMNSIEKYLKNIKKKYDISNEEKSAMVMNCNPFTLGHKYLIEKAAKESKEVLVFIVQEEKSLFPFKVRYKLVKEGVKELKNVKVIPGGDYIISSATFPNYFLRKKDDKLKIFTELDAGIFGNHFCKCLNITRRYVGEEPFCEVTQSYNETLKAVLNQYDVELKVIKRKDISGKAISASEVRELIKQDKWDKINEIVPKTTMDFLEGIDGKEIVEMIKSSNSPH